MKRLIAISLMCAVASAVATGCGDEGPKPAEALDDPALAVDDLGAADSPNSPLKGVLDYDSRIASQLSANLPYHFWDVISEGTGDDSAEVFIDLASRSGGDTFLLVYRMNRFGRYRLWDYNDDCRGSLNSCLTTSLPPGAYRIGVSSYSYIYGGRPDAIDYELEAFCEGGSCKIRSGQGVGETCGGIAALQCAEGLVCNWASDHGCDTYPDQGGFCVDPDEPVACYEIYAPECGCDGVTYDNDCFRVAAGVSLDHAGACETEEPQVCGGIAGFTCDAPYVCDYSANEMCISDMMGTCVLAAEIYCTRHYDPVCGCNGDTYGNDCERRAARVALSHLGACEE